MLSGDRIRLEPLALEHVGEDYLRWVRDPEVNRFLELRFLSDHSLESLRAFVAGLDPVQDRMFRMITKADGRYIGNIKLGGMHPYHRYGDIGLMIGEKSAWGHGYGTESIALLTRHGFEDHRLNKIVAGMYDVNQGSLKAFLANGYVETGRQKRHYHCEAAGGWVDCVWVEKLNPAVQVNSG